jgi:hypothetical protein
MTEAFLTAMAENQSNWGRIAKQIGASGQATITVGQGAFGGTMTTLARTATSGPTASDYFTFESDFSMVNKVLKHTFPKKTYNSEYGFQELGRQLASTAAWFWSFRPRTRRPRTSWLSRRCLARTWRATSSRARSVTSW